MTSALFVGRERELQRLRHALDDGWRGAAALR
jgi:hypothetical protein